MTFRTAASLIAAASLWAAPAMAQETTTEPPAQNRLALTMSIVQVDLSGTGTALGIGFRGTRALNDHLAVELGTFVTRLAQDPGNATFAIGEAHLQYYWRANRVRPFIGGGPGISLLTLGSVADGDFDLSLAAGGGAWFDVRDDISILAELRVRGIGRNFSGSSAEWVTGVSWRIGR